MSRTLLIVGNSQAVKRFYQSTEKIPEEKISVVYNGIDPDEFENLDVDTSLKEKIGAGATFIIGAGGRFTEQKGFINLLKAVPAVLKIFPQTRFVFIGDGPLRRSFEEFVAEKRLEENVVFTGYRRDIIKIFSLCDAIAVPSLFEGMPNTVLEAMALKKPVIGTDIPEIAELVEDGKNGFLVPVNNNEEQIAEKIIVLIKRPELCRDMGKKGYGIVRDRFSMEKMVRGYEEIYQNAKDRKFSSLPQGVKKIFRKE